MPINQYLYLDAIECLPESIFRQPTSPCQSIDLTLHCPSEYSRYFSQEIVFGTEFQKKLGTAKYFLVSSIAMIESCQ